MTIPKLTLYILPGCPYCVRVLDFLEQENITLQIKDISQDAEARNKLYQLTGKTQVPCLQIDDTAMLESLDIIKKLKHIFHKDQ